MMNDGEAIDKGYESLEDLGWDEDFARSFAPHAEKGWIPGRVVVRHKGQYAVQTAAGEVVAKIKGHLRYTAETWAELPGVGDWVALSKKEHDPIYRIQAILDRRTCLQRKVKGTRTESQVLAANVDLVIIVMGLTEDYNLRRLERYLIVVHESGAQAVVVLNKADLLEREWVESSVEEVEAIAGDAQIYVVSALDGAGVEAVAKHVRPAETLVFVGSSGAGKSTLINALLGIERQETGETRNDGKGRHTTTRRELIRFPNGALVIDSPGIREIQIWCESEGGLAEAFADIHELAEQCQFSDCKHVSEPGCAVIQAIERDELDASRYESFMALQRELAHVKKRDSELADTKRRAFREQKKRRYKR